MGMNGDFKKKASINSRRVTDAARGALPASLDQLNNRLNRRLLSPESKTQK